MIVKVINTEEMHQKLLTIYKNIKITVLWNFW